MAGGSSDGAAPLGLGAALAPVLALVVLVALSFYLFGDGGAAGPSQVAIVCAALVAVLVGRLHGHSLEALREAGALRLGQQSPAQRVTDQLGTCGQLQFLHDARTVGLDALWAEAESLCDLARGVPRGHEFEYLALTLAQSVEVVLFFAGLRPHHEVL